MACATVRASELAALLGAATPAPIDDDEADASVTSVSPLDDAVDDATSEPDESAEAGAAAPARGAANAVDSKAACVSDTDGVGGWLEAAERAGKAAIGPCRP